MKRFLLSLMVLTMFMPGLACAEFMKSHQPPMQQTEHMKDMPCCPKKASSDMGTMLFKDCMKVDLQHAGDAPLLKKFDIAKHSFPFVPAIVSAHNFIYAEANAARGPPFERRSNLSSLKLPIFLATQRLRI